MDKDLWDTTAFHSSHLHLVHTPHLLANKFLSVFQDRMLDRLESMVPIFHDIFSPYHTLVYFYRRLSRCMAFPHFVAVYLSAFDTLSRIHAGLSQYNRSTDSIRMVWA